MPNILNPFADIISSAQDKFTVTSKRDSTMKTLHIVLSSGYNTYIWRLWCRYGSYFKQSLRNACFL